MRRLLSETPAPAETGHARPWLHRGQGALAALAAALALAVSYPIPTLRTTALVVLATATCAALLWRHLGRDLRSRALVAAVAIVAAIVLRDAWTAGAGIGVLLAAGARHGAAGIRSTCGGLLLAVTVGSFLLLVDGTGLLWHETSRVSWTLSGFLTGIAGDTQRLGPSQTTIPWLLLVVGIWVGQLWWGRPSWDRQLRLAPVILLASVGSLVFGQVALALGAVGLVAVFGQWAVDPAPRPARRWLGLGAVAAVVMSVVGAVAFCRGAVDERPPSPTLGIVDGGLKTLELPDAQVFDEADQAQFGGLTRLLPLYGWSVRIIEEYFEPQALEGLTVLAIINPTVYLQDNQKAAVQAFVRGGGRLLVLGDHTDIGGIMGPLNDLLDFTSIRFKFDSAIPGDSPLWKWKHCLRGALSPSFYRRANDRFGISVGASLETGSSARVLVLADRGFSDIGRPDYGISRLGDMQYNPGELKGGLPLVAEERVGHGVVQVWGDTAGFQLSSLTTTGTFIAGSLDDLARRRPAGNGRRIVAACLVVVLLGATMVLALHPVHLLAALLGGGLALSGLGTVFFAPPDAHVERDLASAAVLDLSHAPSAPAAAPPRGLHRLGEIFVRHGTILLGSRDFQSGLADGPAWWVIVAPNRRYSRREADQLEAYVRAGGRLLVFAGYRHRAALENVLTRFGVEIDPSMFGSAHNSRIARDDWRQELLEQALPSNRGQVPDPDDPFARAYDAEIQCKEIHPVLAEGAEALLTCWGKPIAVHQRHGDGSFVLIADSRFVNDENLQDGEGAASRLNVRNAKFLLQCLEL